MFLVKFIPLLHAEISEEPVNVFYEEELFIESFEVVREPIRKTCYFAF